MLKSIQDVHASKFVGKFQPFVIFEKLEKSMK